MNKISTWMAGLFLISALVLNANAATTLKRTSIRSNADRAVANTETSSQALAEPTSPSTTQVGFGFTTVGGTNAPALSTLIEINGRHTVQVQFGIDGTSPSFGFNAGAGYHYTAAGDNMAGFHLGGAFTVGTAVANGAFVANILPNVGFHYRVSNTPVLLSLDGGPIVQIAGGSANFGLSANSQLFGFSAHYMF